MIVEVLAVGTELLLGQIVNTNAAEIGSRLAEVGLDHYRQTVVGDNLDRMIDALMASVRRSDAVIVTGGIGPTQDDITREAMAAAADVDMMFSDEFAVLLRERWAASGREMPESNLRQAEYPEGAEMLANPKGTAPGLRMLIHGTWVFALPGVPAEMLPMVDEHVLPFLVSRAGGEEAVLVSTVIRSWGRAESQISEICADLFEDSGNPTVAFLASSGEIKVRLTAHASDEEAARALLQPVVDEVVSRIGHTVFAIDGPPTEEMVLDLLRERGWTMATAESATGGLIAAKLTGVPGASDVFAGSIVAYATRLKQSALDVDSEVIEEHGVVSEETALAMARGAVERLGVDVAVAITGSAGPTLQEQAAGTMVLAVVTPEGSGTRTVRLPGDRERVRVYATTAALHLLRLGISGAWWGA